MLGLQTTAATWSGIVVSCKLIMIKVMVSIYPSPHVDLGDDENETESFSGDGSKHTSQVHIMSQLSCPYMSQMGAVLGE